MVGGITERKAKNEMAIDPNNSSGGVYVSYVVCEKKKKRQESQIFTHTHI